MNNKAKALRFQNRVCQALIQSMGWKVQGGLGGHYRPLALVMPHSASWKVKMISRLFRWTLADPKRIHFIVLPSQPLFEELVLELRNARETCTWLSCIGLDQRHCTISVHRPFQFGSFQERETNYLLRYLGYFEGETFSPPASPAAQAAEQEGY